MERDSQPFSAAVNIYFVRWVASASLNLNRCLPEAGTDSQSNMVRERSKTFPGLIDKQNKNTHMTTEKKIRISLSFNSAGDAIVLETAGSLLTNLYGNPAFPAPPVLEVTLQGAVTALTTAIAAQVQGGTAATAAKNNRKAELVNLLEARALHVQVACENDMAKLLSSGFQSVSQNRAQSQLPKPAGVRLENGLSGQLLLTADRIPNARCFEIDLALIDDEGKPGAMTTAGLHTKSRKMPVNGLIPGKLYLFRTRAVGGLTGYSDWSDPVSHRAL